MADIAKLGIDINNRKAIQEIKKVNRGISQLDKNTRAIKSAFKYAAGGIVAFAAVGLSIKGIKGVLNITKDLTDAYSKQEDALNDLTATLGVMGIEGTATFDRIVDSAASLQKVTKAGDEAIISATANVGLLAKELSGEELAQSQKALIGIADVFFKGDLESAALQVGKSIGSATNSLSRYGITVDTTATQSEKLAQIMAQTSGFFEVSKARATTLSGRIAQLGNAWGDLKEKLGGFLAHNDAVTQFITKTKQMVVDLTDVLEGSKAQIQEGFKLLGTIAGNAFVVAFMEVAIIPLNALWLKMVGSWAPGAKAAAEALNGIIVGMEGLSRGAKENISTALDDLHKLAALARVTRAELDLPTLEPRLASTPTTELREIRTLIRPELAPDSERAGFILRNTVRDNEEAAEAIRIVWDQSLRNTQDAMSGFIGEILSGTKEGESAFKNFVNNMVQMLQRLVAEFLAARAIGALTSAFGSGAGSKGDKTTMPKVIESFAQGGIVGPANLSDGSTLIRAHPGEMVSPRGQVGSPIYQTVNYNISAMDAKSFDTFARQHAAIFAHATSVGNQRTGR